MKLTVWDILSVVLILSTLCLCGFFGYLLIDERGTLNPFPPPTLLPTIEIVFPDATVTPRQRAMPATWTPIVTPEQESGRPTLRPSSTIQPTSTSFVIPSFTPSATATATPTNTPTTTNTPTVTPYPTATPPPTLTQPPAAP